MYFDRFDIVEAYWLWMLDFYNGVMCPNYARCCRLQTKFRFKPSPMLTYETLSENGKLIYDQLEEKEFISREYR